MARGTLRVVAHGLYYLPTYLIDDKWTTSTGECSLFVREFELVESAKGLKVRVRSDVLSFPDDDAMTEAIEAHGMVELPAEAETDQLFIPEELRDEGVKAEIAMGRVKLPEVVA